MHATEEANEKRPLLQIHANTSTSLLHSTETYIIKAKTMGHLMCARYIYYFFKSAISLFTTSIIQQYFQNYSIYFQFTVFNTKEGKQSIFCLYHKIIMSQFL